MREARESLKNYTAGLHGRGLLGLPTFHQSEAIPWHHIKAEVMGDVVYMHAHKENWVCESLSSPNTDVKELQESL